MCFLLFKRKILSLGYEQVELDVFLDNENVQGLYEKNGFEFEVEVRVILNLIMEPTLMKLLWGDVYYKSYIL